MTKNHLTLIIILALLAAVSILIAVANRRRIRPYYDLLDALSKQISGTLSKSRRFFLNYPSLTGTVSGQKYLLSYVTDENSRPFGLTLECFVSSPSDMKIYMYEQDPGTVLFAERIDIGDRAFANYFMYSNRPEEAKRYFSNEVKRSMVRQLVADGWHLPMITGHSIRTLRSDIKPSLDAELIRSTIRNLIALRIEHQ